VTGAQARSVTLKVPAAIEAAPLRRDLWADVNEVRSRLSEPYFRTAVLRVSERLRLEHRASRSTIIPKACRLYGDRSGWTVPRWPQHAAQIRRNSAN